MRLKHGDFCLQYIIQKRFWLKVRKYLLKTAQSYYVERVGGGRREGGEILTTVCPKVMTHP